MRRRLRESVLWGGGRGEESQAKGGGGGGGGTIHVRWCGSMYVLKRYDWI